MSDAPERIWINKVHGQHPEDWDFTDGKHLTKTQLRQKVEYIRADHIEALTELLEAARRDAKEAEAYAEELEKELNICRMAQVVMENGIAEAEKERDDYAFKLAKAVEALDEALYFLKPTESDMEKRSGIYRIVATIAELKGTTNDQG